VREREKKGRERDGRRAREERESVCVNSSSSVHRAKPRKGASSFVSA
jgi:hypothetical protein